MLKQQKFKFAHTFVTVCITYSFLLTLTTNQELETSILICHPLKTTVLTPLRHIYSVVIF